MLYMLYHRCGHNMQGNENVSKLHTSKRLTYVHHTYPPPTAEASKSLTLQSCVGGVQEQSEISRSLRFLTSLLRITSEPRMR